MHERFISNPFSTKKPLRKYGSLSRDASGELFYEQDDGIPLPYVGPVVDFKEDDPEHLRPQLRHNACVAQFDLSDEDHLSQYRALCAKVCRQEAIISYEEKIYDAEIKSWRILIRWMEPYFGPPGAALRLIKETVKANQGRMPKRPRPRTIFKKQKIHQPEDLAQVQANAGEPSEQVESNDEIPARYGTFDEAISAFGHLLPELGAPAEDGE